ncbi:cation:proton antiporter [Lacisediminihabitans sp. H27-G8]|uniref:cation:proton antiporter n=1 Tax=Lacisediminihabitans sp. H27-G8 TaxID=3111909 RepID=UPI0038FBF7ED
MDGSVLTIIWIVSFVLVTVAVTGLSRRVGWSAPVTLVAVGAVASFLPWLPRIEVQPELVLYGLLPPLLFAAAIRTSLVDVRARRDSILTLSVGLVLFTVVVVGFFTWLIVPAISLATGFAFAAVVAPTDAVAITSISGRLRLPRRVVTVLEGESLFNDAAALVALSAAMAAIVGTLNPWAVAADFVLAVVVGVGFGLAAGFGLSAIRKTLKAPVLDTSLSLATPFVAFIPTQLLHGSGVLAVVIAGLIIGTQAPVVQSAQARIADSVNWRTIRFLLENSVFLFIGLNLKGILRGVADSGFGIAQVVLICVGMLVFLIAARFAWILAVSGFYRVGPKRFRERSWSGKATVAIGFSGMRGVVTLAAVFLLPDATPQKSFLQFLAFAVVVGTLVQGLALPWIIRRLKLPPPNADQELVEAQMLMAEARAAGVVRLDAERMEADDAAVVERLRNDATLLGESLLNPVDDGVEPAQAVFGRLRLAMIEAERAAVLAARREGRYQEPAVRAILASIDAEEIAVRVIRHNNRNDG